MLDMTFGVMGANGERDGGGEGQKLTVALVGKFETGEAEPFALAVVDAVLDRHVVGPGEAACECARGDVVGGAALVFPAKRLDHVREVLGGRGNLGGVARLRCGVLRAVRRWVAT